MRPERADDVIAAGVLHDTIEKASTNRTELRRRFGARTATLVAALTEDERIRGYATRKAALRRQVEAAGVDALMVFAADKVSKVRELPLERSGAKRRPLRGRGSARSRTTGTAWSCSSVTSPTRRSCSSCARSSRNAPRCLAGVARSPAPS